MRLRGSVGIQNQSRNDFLSDMAQHLMLPRPDWNALGPYINQSFRDRLSEIDHDLVLQFFPPDPLLRHQFPYGFWSVCMRLRHTRMLYKKSVLDLYDPTNLQFVQPGPMHLEMLRRARARSFSSGLDALVKECDRHLAESEKKKHSKYIHDLGNRVDASLRHFNVTWKKLGKAVAFVP